MRASRKLTTRPRPWFWVGLAGLLVLSAGLRFWGLERFDTLVFDEVYFARFAHNYLSGTPFFDAHPPLGKYLIAVGIQLGGANPFGYRWMNALTGCLIPLVVAGIAYQLSQRRSYALLAGVFAVVDGLLLVESRYALINIYLLMFGLLGQWFFLLGLDTSGGRRWLWLTLSGVSLGGAISVKWSGLGFFLGIYLTWALGWVVQMLFGRSHSSEQPQAIFVPSPWPRPAVPQLRLKQLPQFFYQGAIAVLIYWLQWIPHLRQNQSADFWQLQQQMFSYHGRIGSGSEVHPYCSAWYTWPWMLRPVDYFYQTALNRSEPVPAVGPRLPQTAVRVIYDVHAIGNPALWWLSTLAILVLIWVLARQIETWIVQPTARLDQFSANRTEFWLPLYLVMNYAANFLPWAGVSRCIFLYHYLPASMYSLLAIAWLVSRWVESARPLLRGIGITAIFLILVAFVFWLPIYLGLPLSPTGFRLRMWLPSWI